MSPPGTRLLLACRGSAQDGLGHVIRTRALAERIPDWMTAEIVVIGDELAEPLLGDMALPWRIIQDERELVERADAMLADVVVFDTIPLADDVFKALARDRMTVSLSPIFDHLDEVDLAFNRTRYERGGGAAHPNRRYGLEYAIVRSECERIDTGYFRRQLARDRLAVAVSMGGADAPNRTLAVLEALRELPAPTTLWALLGEGYEHSYDQLVAAVRADHSHEVILAKTNQSMWTILQNCSIAILAGGVTTYESAFAGLPSVNLLQSRDHEFLVRELVEADAALNAGEPDAAGMARLVELVSALESDRDHLFNMHLHCRSLLDDQGADRVLGEIVAHARARARAATAEPA